LLSPEEFIAARQSTWEKLDHALQHRSHLRRMSATQVLELGELYRQVTADLAIARRDYPRDRVTIYLNNLVGRGHATIYQGKVFEWRQIIHFYRYGFPAAYREALPYTLAAFLLTALSGIACFILTLLQPSIAEASLPSALVATVHQHQMWTDIQAPMRSLAAAQIMTNNIQVALTAFALGTLFGIGTIIVLVQNGIMLGLVAGYCQLYGLSAPLWSFVAAHGFIELSVIFMSGSAGFMLGDAILRPGLCTRGAALREAGLRSVRLLFGATPLLVIAGTLEGFVSPSGLSPWLKLAIGLTSAILLYSYLFLSREGSAPAGEDPVHRRA